MKTITRKSEITSNELKTNDVEFRGFKLGYNKKDELYFIGNLFTEVIYTYCETIEDVKFSF